MYTSGGSSLGWGLGAAIGAHCGYAATQTMNDLTVLVTGDGSFLFGVPASAFWIARRYQTPFLTIILNNGTPLDPVKLIKGLD
jgi:thiamine pyrophosphate-dependent acetolactate synthase large subunit-like protein